MGRVDDNSTPTTDAHARHPALAYPVRGRHRPRRPARRAVLGHSAQRVMHDRLHHIVAEDNGGRHAPARLRPTQRFPPRRTGHATDGQTSAWTRTGERSRRSKHVRGPQPRLGPAAKKYVVSSTLGPVDWSAELGRGDLRHAVQQLNRESGKGLLVGGGSSRTPSMLGVGRYRRHHIKCWLHDAAVGWRNNLAASLR